MYFFSLYYCYAQPQIWFVNNNCTKNTFFLFRAPTDSRCFIFGIKIHRSSIFLPSLSTTIHVCFHKIWQLFIRAKNFIDFAHNSREITKIINLLIFYLFFSDGEFKMEVEGIISCMLLKNFYLKKKSWIYFEFFLSCISFQQTSINYYTILFSFFSNTAAELLANKKTVINPTLNSESIYLYLRHTHTHTTYTVDAMAGQLIIN